MRREAATNVPSLDALAAEDTIVRQLLRTMRDGRGRSLTAAAAELSAMLEQLGSDTRAVHDAADRVRELILDIQAADRPRAVVAGNIEGWYAGPRSEDPSWSALEQVLRDEGFDDDALAAVDTSSTKVVAYLPNPHSPEAFSAHGLVLGYVQSGKTTNFTAVIAKAADAGYRFFIVLSGVHNALRQQTQDRLNAQLWGLGRDRWFRLTNDDDFRANDHVDAVLAASDQRVIAIVKKNGPRLRALNQWLKEARPETLEGCPVLIIDDEADQASINTAKPEKHPTRISSLIRDLVDIAPRSAYVGYTATPFANVLIDPKEARSLYPKDFIVDLPRPKQYIGPEAIFGRDPLDLDAEDPTDEGHDFIRAIDEDELPDLRPMGASSRHEFSASITPSLRDAIDYFVLSTAARRVRGAGNRHATALVHTSQHVDVHRKTAETIEAHVSALAGRIAQNDTRVLDRLRETWEREAESVPAEDFELEPVRWADLAPLLSAVAADVEVITDNSQSTERLSFDDDRPRAIIAVGGNTLSRGLTLEGLAVSFFVRTASAYDTLLQMGRWFGYRSGYADVTRIWMTDTMREWFHHLATVEQEIRYDIERLERSHVTPLELGVRIRTHPKLAITSAAKMQGSKRAEASYSGRRVQTILFNHRDRDWLQNNLEAGRALVKATASSPRVQRANATVIGPVPTERIIDFLAAYLFHENSVDLKSDLINGYLRDRIKDRELTHFKIAVMRHSRPSPRLGALDLGLGEPLPAVNRARLMNVGTTYVDIKALMSQPDRIVDLDVEWSDKRVQNLPAGKLRNTPQNGGLGDGTGLLVLYPISKDSVPTVAKSNREPLNAVEHMLGIGLVFPETNAKHALVDYVTANIPALSVGDVETPDEQDDLDESEPTEAA